MYRPRMAHLIQILRQTIRNKDKEIEKWVDVVNQLQRNDELDPPELKPLLADAKVGWICEQRNGLYSQIKAFGDSWGTDDCFNPNLFTVFLADNTTRNIYGTYLGTMVNPLPNDIIHTEPLAEVGTAEWAWQMAKLGIETRCYEGKIKVSKSGLIEVCYNGMAYAMPLTQSPDNKAYTIKKISQCSPTGWQLYEEPKPTYAVPQDIINYMFAAWVKSGMYYKDFDRHVIDMMNDLMTRTLVCYGDEDDHNIGIIPLRAMLDRQVHAVQLRPLKTHCHGENIRYIPNIEEDYIHSPINEKTLEQMEDLMVVALWGIMREEDNDDAAHWKAYQMSIGPIYSYNISDEMGGKVGGCLTKEQLLGKYERAVEDMFNEFGEEK